MYIRTALLACICICYAMSCSRTDRNIKPDDLITLPVDTLNVSFEIGEELGDSTCTFWSIVAADIDSRGRVYVLDRIDASLRVYDLLGNYIQHVTCRGPGPGELVSPRGLAIMPDGRIIITTPRKCGYVIFNKEYELIEEVGLWLNNGPYHVAPVSNNKIVLCRYNCATGVERQTAAIHNIGEEEWETLLWRDSILISDAEWLKDPGSTEAFSNEHLLRAYGDGAGNIYFAVLDSLEYRIIQWDSTGSELLNITRDMTPVEKSPEELAAESFYLNSIAETMWGPQDWEIRPDRYRNMIVDVGIGPDENLWARRGTRDELFFDVYDLSGNLMRHETFTTASWSWQTKITPFGILAWERDPLDGYQKLYLLE